MDGISEREDKVGVRESMIRKYLSFNGKKDRFGRSIGQVLEGTKFWLA